MVRLANKFRNLLYDNGVLSPRLTVKTKIWMTVITIVLMFAFFVLFYLPAIQERYVLNNFNKDVQNHANTVALGVKIAITEQNFEGVQTAMDFVKQNPELEFVSLLQVDTMWNKPRTRYVVNRSIFQTYPATIQADIHAASDEFRVVKHAYFSTPLMNGEVLLAASTREIIQSRRQIRITSLFFSFVVFAIGILIGFGLSRNISVPVLELRDAANKVGEGDLSQRVKNKSRDEIGELGIAFNKMVNDLARARKDVDDRTAELTSEKKKTDELLDDLTLTLTNLKETQEQLIRQEKFVSIAQLTKGIVDRLLNPLNYINNFSAISGGLLSEVAEFIDQSRTEQSVIIADELTSLVSMVQANLGKIQSHGESLSRIVQSTEKLLRLKSDTFQVVNINDFLEKQVKIIVQDIRSGSINGSEWIRTDLENQRHSVTILPVEVASVMRQLLDNAVYAVQERVDQNNWFIPDICVQTRFTDTCVLIRIRDNGKGIAAGELNHLFTPFFTTKPTAKGTGLGLFISQDIIRHHRGSIAVESIEGSCTTFTVQLPLND